MPPHWRKEPVDTLQEEIARIRQLSQQIDHAHEMVTANTQLLDRHLIGSGALREGVDLHRDESQVGEGVPPRDVEAPRRTPHRRRRR
jgi:hypothetical protein